MEPLEIEAFDRFKYCNFIAIATTFPFAKRWICYHCGTELNYRPVSISEFLNKKKDDECQDILGK